MCYNASERLTHPAWYNHLHQQNQPDIIFSFLDCMSAWGVTDLCKHDFYSSAMGGVYLQSERAMRCQSISLLVIQRPSNDARAPSVVSDGVAEMHTRASRLDGLSRLEVVVDEVRR
jgi:hypothetical protein